MENVKNLVTEVWQKRWNTGQHADDSHHCG